MKKLVTLGLLTAFLSTFVSCQQDDTSKRKGSRRGSKSMAQTEQHGINLQTIKR